MRPQEATNSQPTGRAINDDDDDDKEWLPSEDNDKEILPALIGKEEVDSYDEEDMHMHHVNSDFSDSNYVIFNTMDDDELDDLVCGQVGVSTSIHARNGPNNVALRARTVQLTAEHGLFDLGPRRLAKTRDLFSLDAEILAHVNKIIIDSSDRNSSDSRAGHLPMFPVTSYLAQQA